MMRPAFALLALVIMAPMAAALPGPDISIPIPSGSEVVEGDTLVVYHNDCPAPHEGPPRGCEPNSTRVGPRDIPVVSVSGHIIACPAIEGEVLACAGARWDTGAPLICARTTRDAADDACARA